MKSNRLILPVRIKTIPDKYANISPTIPIPRIWIFLTNFKIKNTNNPPMTNIAHGINISFNHHWNYGKVVAPVIPSIFIIVIIDL